MVTSRNTAILPHRQVPKIIRCRVLSAGTANNIETYTERQPPRQTKTDIHIGWPKNNANKKVNSTKFRHHTRPAGYF